MFLALTLGLSACSEKAEVDTGSNNKSAFCAQSEIPNQFIVQWKDGSVSLEHATDEDEFFEKVLLDNEDQIEKAEHNHRINLLPPVRDVGEGTLSTSAAPINWGVEKIEAPMVWPHADGGFADGSGIIVAVIDSGMDVSNSQLSGRLEINVAERDGTAGVDDDGNGLIDDVNGFDFFSNTGNVTEVLVGSSHGTHVSGIIAAEHTSPTQPKGVAPGAKLLPLNFMDSSAGGTLSDAIRAIDYAVSRGARIINASWGSNFCSSILENRVGQLSDQGVLFVAAAGNSGSDIEIFPEFPASYTFGHQITVGASTINDIRAGFSNFSGNLVQLLAPGFEIISTVPSDDNSPSKDGTSMAAPFVSGVAAVLMSAAPNASVSQIRSAILDSVDKPVNIGSSDASTQGRLNLRNAYNLLMGTDL